MSDKDSHSLQSILDAISKIIQFTQPFSDPDRLFHDVKTFDAVISNDLPILKVEIEKIMLG